MIAIPWANRTASGSPLVPEVKIIIRVSASAIGAAASAPASAKCSRQVHVRSPSAIAEVWSCLRCRSNS